MSSGIILWSKRVSRLQISRAEAPGAGIEPVTFVPPTLRFTDFVPVRAMATSTWGL